MAGGPIVFVASGGGTFGTIFQYGFAEKQTAQELPYAGLARGWRRVQTRWRRGALILCEKTPGILRHIMYVQMFVPNNSILRREPIPFPCRYM